MNVEAVQLMLASHEPTWAFVAASVISLVIRLFVCLT